MRKKSTYPTPILGVCTLPAVRRPVGMAKEQINFRSNPQHSLSRRARLEWVKMLIPEDIEVKHHFMRRNGKEYRVLLRSTGEVIISVDEVITEGVVPEDYMGKLQDMQIEQINDVVIILNTKKTVRMSTEIEGYMNQPTHINVTTALQYETTLEMDVTRVTKTGEEVGKVKVVYTVEGVDYTEGTYAAADNSRRTDKVAEEIWKQLNGNTDGGVLWYYKELISMWTAWRDTIVNQLIRPQ